MRRPVCLLTDYGIGDSYVGQVKGVIATTAPGSPIVDITHDIEPFAVDEAAWTLEVTLPHLPEDAVIMAVVDPGVGSDRAALVLEDREGRLLVGPDNGLLAGAVADDLRVNSKVNLGRSDVLCRVLNLPNLGIDPSKASATFHGRDVFGRVAALLASEISFEAVGESISSITSCGSLRASPSTDAALEARVIHIDRFGNLVTTLHRSQLPTEEIALLVRGTSVSHRVRTFGDLMPGELGWHEDSSGFIALAGNQMSAATSLGASRGDPILVKLR